MDTATQVLSILAVLLALAAYVIVTQSERRRRTAPALRSIPAYSALPLLVGEAIEADRPMLTSLGSSGLGAADTLVTLAAAEVIYQLAQRATIGDQTPIVGASDPSAVPLAHATLHRAYAGTDRLARMRPGTVRWYPSESQALAFAAALSATVADDRAASLTLVGNSGPEIGLILEAGQRRGLPSIAHGTRLDGQAVAWALSDYPIIGEEIFAAGAYLSPNAGQRATVGATDVLRWVLIALILLAAANALTDGVVLGALARLLGGG